MRTAARVLVPVLALLAAGCGDRQRLAQPPPPGDRAEVALPPPGPFVRVLSPQPAEAVADPPPSPLDVRRIDHLQLADVPLDVACRLLGRLIGVNVAASAAARTQRVSLQLDAIQARAALEGLCRLHGLWYREDPGMVRVLTAAEYGGEMVVRNEDETRIYYLRNASAVGVAELVSSLMPGQIAFNRPADDSSFSHLAGEAAGVTTDSATVERTAEVRRENYGTQVNVSAGQAASPAQAAQAAQAARQGGGGGAAIGSREVAARSGGRGAAVVSVFMRNNCIAVRAVDEALHREVGRIIAELDTPTRQVLLEVKVLSLALSNGFESFFNLAYRDSGPPQVSASFLNGAATSGSTVSFSVLDSTISASMQLLQSDGRMSAIASPMLLAANNAPAEFFSGVTRMITTSYDNETRYAENGVATDISRPVVQEREIGTTVRITPSINDDGTVTLRFFLQTGTVNQGGAAISEVVDGEVVQLPIDTVDNQRLTSVVVANHGQAVVMGGLISESASFQRSRVPGLGEIPALGMLFRSQNDRIQRTETVMLITPHIMAAPEAGAETGGRVLRRGSAHPWVRHDQAPVTVYDERDQRLKAVEHPAPKPAPTPQQPGTP